MYYINTNQPDTNSWHHSYQMQNWENQNRCHHAQNVARDWSRNRDNNNDWEAIDAHSVGDHYKVHLRDSRGDYRTVVMDHDYHVQQWENRYY